MQSMPVELLQAVVKEVSVVEDLAALGRVSRTWQRIVEGSLSHWVQHLPMGEHFANITGAGLWVLQRFADGEVSFL